MGWDNNHREEGIKASRDQLFTKGIDLVSKYIENNGSQVSHYPSWEKT